MPVSSERRTECRKGISQLSPDRLNRESESCKFPIYASICQPFPRFVQICLLFLCFLVEKVTPQASDLPVSKFIWFTKLGSVPLEVSEGNPVVKIVRYSMSSLVNSADQNSKYDTHFAKMQPGFTLGLKIALVVKARPAGDTGLYVDGFNFKIVISPTASM